MEGARAAGGEFMGRRGYCAHAAPALFPLPAPPHHDIYTQHHQRASHPCAALRDVELRNAISRERAAAQQACSAHSFGMPHSELSQFLSSIISFSIEPSPALNPGYICRWLTVWTAISA